MKLSQAIHVDITSSRPPRRRRIARQVMLAVLCGIFSSLGLRADLVTEWNEALTRTTAEGPELVPHLEARAYAMVHLAIDQAVTICGRDASGRTARDDELQAAISTAARDVAVHLVPAAAERFDSFCAARLAEISATDGKSHGIQAGHDAAELVLAMRRADEWAQLPATLAAMDDYGEASGASAAALLAQGRSLPPSPWLAAKPFVIKKAEQFKAARPYSLDRNGTVFADLSLRRSKLFDRMAVDIPAEELTRYWSERPVVIWNRVACALTEQTIGDLASRARFFAVLNLALADATVATQHWRYTFGTWTSTMTEGWVGTDKTYADVGDVVAAIDAGETAIVQKEMRRVLIPPLRDFPALAPAMAGAAQAVFTWFCRTDNMSFALSAAKGPMSDTVATRTFSSISAAARECALATALDGRHCREACISGYELGRAVGDYAVKQAKKTGLKP